MPPENRLPAPRKATHMPSVAINDGSPTRVTRKPLSPPTASPSSTMTDVANQGSTFRFSMRMEMTTISSPYRPPTDRSISPATNRYVMPAATMPSGATRRASATSVVSEAMRELAMSKKANNKIATNRMAMSRLLTRRPMAERQLRACTPPSWRSSSASSASVSTSSAASNWSMLIHVDV